jgi:hypothetical protein
MGDKNYSIKVRGSGMFQAALALLIVILGIYMVMTSQEQRLLWIVYVILGLAFMFRFFNMPKEIKVDEELLTFKNWFGKEKMVYIKDLKRIIKRMGYLYFYTEEKKIISTSRLGELKKFADDMKARNPQVEISGIK